MIFIRYPFLGDLKVLDYEKNSICADVIKKSIESHLGYSEFSLFYNGKLLQENDDVPEDSTVEVVLSLPGGKGGFGSMLRAIGAQIEKTTNREACRDLSGRRLRDINEEQRLKKWIAKEAEREAEKIRRRQARIERLKTKAPHKFFDFEYEKEISELPDRINDALSEGLQKAKQPNKRPAEKTELPKKLWLGDEFSGSSSGSEADEAPSSSASGSQPKKVKLTPKDTPGYDSDTSESSSSMQYPSSSKDSCFSMEENSVSSNLKIASTEESRDENSTDSVNVSQDAKSRNENSSDSVNIGQDAKSRDETSSDSINVSQDAKSRDENSTDSMNVSHGAEETQQYEGSRDGQYDGADTSLPISESKIDKPGSSKMESVVMKVKEAEEKAENGDKNATEANVTNTAKSAEMEDDSQIDLLDFQSASELEALGLDRLKSALMARGLKCGGTLSDRAQRLWKVRGLLPHQYPANLLAKNKK